MFTVDVKQHYHNDNNNSEQVATDQTDPWQSVPRQIFTPYDCLLISVAFVVLCRVGCLWVTGVKLVDAGSLICM